MRLTGFIKGVFMKNTVKNGFRLFGISTLAALIVFSMAGCGSERTGDISSPGSQILLGISVNTDNAKIEYHIDDELDLSGLVVTAVYNNNTSKEVSNSELIISGFDSTEAGLKNLLVEWNGMFAEFAIVVDDVLLDRIEIRALPAKTIYYTGDAADHTGLVVSAVYCHSDGSNESREDINGYLLNISDIDPDLPGNQNISVSYGGKSVEFSITMNVLMSIAIIEKPATMIYKIGEPIDLTGLKVKATYNGINSTSNWLNIKAENISGYDSKTTGRKNVRVSYNGESNDFEVTVQNYVTFITSGGYWGNNEDDTASKTAWVDLNTQKVIDVPGTPSKRYYNFSSWNINGGNNQWNPDDIITGDITLTAEWTPKTFTDIDEIKGYLDSLPRNTVDNPASLPVKIELDFLQTNDSNWQKLLEVISGLNEDVYVNLDLSECDMDDGCFRAYSNNTALGKRRIVSIVLPNAATTISTFIFFPAFNGFDNLKSVSCGENLTLIEASAFSANTKLVLVTFHAANPRPLGTGVFGSSPNKDLQIKVPAAYLDTYKAAEGWNSYANHISGF